MLRDLFLRAREQTGERCTLSWQRDGLLELNNPTDRMDRAVTARRYPREKCLAGSGMDEFGVAHFSAAANSDNLWYSS
jgi:hypothetical protein